jgi:hypothetical protein
LFVAPVVVIEFDKDVAGALEREGLLSVSAGIVAGLKRYKR